MKVMPVMIGFPGENQGLEGWVGVAWGRLTNMRSQEENGEQPGGHQPDHALESAQASQDELGPRSVAQGLATQPVLVGVCWCWRGRGNEVAWEGGVAGERSGENSCFWASGVPSPAPARLRMGVAWKVLLRNGVT